MIHSRTSLDAFPPSTGRSWISTTRAPARAAVTAQHVPDVPPPTMTRSASSCSVRKSRRCSAGALTIRSICVLPSTSNCGYRRHLHWLGRRAALVSNDAVALIHKASRGSCAVNNIALQALIVGSSRTPPAPRSPRSTPTGQPPCPHTKGLLAPSTAGRALLALRPSRAIAEAEGKPQLGADWVTPPRRRRNDRVKIDDNEPPCQLPLRVATISLNETRVSSAYSAI